MLIKENCWKWPAGEGYHFVKVYREPYLKQKVKWIHDMLSSIHFPYILPVIQSDASSIHQPWQHHSRSVDFANAAERTSSLQCLNALHATNQQIAWQKGAHLPTFHLYTKWVARLNKFIEHEALIKEKIGYKFYQETVNYAKNALEHITPMKRTEPLTILHGDVVHHNFLYCEDDTIKLIDFDLACIGDAREELVLWCHRVLPHMDYDIEALFREQPQLQVLREMKYYLTYPNELMREALYYVKLDDDDRRYYREFFDSFASEALENWSQLQSKVYAQSNFD